MKRQKTLLKIALALVIGMFIGLYGDYLNLQTKLESTKVEKASLEASLQSAVTLNENIRKDSFNQIEDIKELNKKIDEDTKAILSTVPIEYTYGRNAYNLRELVSQASKEFRIPVTILVALGHIESNWNCRLIGPAQDTGCFQIIPSTGLWAMKRLGIEGSDLLNPLVNIRVGAWVLRTFTDAENGDWAKGLASYNAGPGAWDRSPTVSRGYAAKVLSRTVTIPNSK